MILAHRGIAVVVAVLCGVVACGSGEDALAQALNSSQKEPNATSECEHFMQLFDFQNQMSLDYATMSTIGAVASSPQIRSDAKPFLGRQDSDTPIAICTVTLTQASVPDVAENFGGVGQRAVFGVWSGGEGQVWLMGNPHN